MATQTHSRLAAHIARGNVTLSNVPPAPIPVPAPARAPTPPTGSGGGGQPPAGSGGGGPPPPDGGGGGQPPTGGGGGGQANPPAVPSLRLCGNPPEIFMGDREKADRFLS
jgi:Retrotransposon gag protein